MRAPRVRFTVRELMVAVLAAAILLGWVVSWEQLRVRGVRATARSILAEDTNDPLSSYASPEEAIAAAQRVGEKGHMWAGGWPDPHVVAGGAIVDFGVGGLALAISKAVAVGVRKGRRRSESS